MSRCMVLYVGPDGSSRIGHHGIELRDPDGYARRLAANNHAAHLVDLDTGEVYGVDLLCPHCDGGHGAPYDGRCLI